MNTTYAEVQFCNINATIPTFRCDSAICIEIVTALSKLQNVTINNM